jgi:hypothetical protein
VIHTRTGQSAYFDRAEDLLAFIQRWTGDLLTASDEDITRKASCDHRKPTMSTHRSRIRRCLATSTKEWMGDHQVWREQIEHVQSGERIYFQELAKIIELIRAKIWRGGDE